MVNLTQEQVDLLINTLNHRMTKIEVNTKWLIWVTCVVVGLLGKIAFF